jgi:hypothetical protein
LVYEGLEEVAGFFVGRGEGEGFLGFGFGGGGGVLLFVDLGEEGVGVVEVGV